LCANVFSQTFLTRHAGPLQKRHPLPPWPAWPSRSRTCSTRKARAAPPAPWCCRMRPRPHRRHGRCPPARGRRGHHRPHPYGRVRFFRRGREPAFRHPCRAGRPPPRQPSAGAHVAGAHSRRLLVRRCCFRRQRRRLGGTGLGHRRLHPHSRCAQWPGWLQKHGQTGAHRRNSASIAHTGYRLRHHPQRARCRAAARDSGRAQSRQG
jgi:hypothetical protein